MNKKSAKAQQSIKKRCRLKVRPWGNYHKLFEESGVWVKRVEVSPGARLSLQKHACRSEKWIVVTGQGLVVLGKRKIKVKAGAVIDVPTGAVHRIGNTGKKKLVFIEVACGSYLGEDDIVRLQDDYQRSIQPKSSFKVL